MQPASTRAAAVTAALGVRLAGRWLPWAALPMAAADEARVRLMIRAWQDGAIRAAK
eukprot:CAMPEP_0115670010 /NCGR_PEP_ID=MMETSP0272-20121206/51300_1 /TAXON_ID=71861 /ORGANISM="Scrippsiella trochoidea, Strain CCMP3099" /LENGTH=55 /DNA_ID=CAMNT_0003108705 /DNA_START=502 /DNA_END=666 /DNA_ORIENTATION=+